MNRVGTAVILLFLFGLRAHAQQAPLSLDQAVQQALDRYPAMRASIEQVSAAAAGINLARTSYLPRMDLLAQENRATHNNVFGQLLPQSVIPSMTGPVLGTNSLNSVWGSGVGALVSWEPFDFGLRRANVDLAKASRDRANAQVSVTKLQVATAAADAYLTILAAQQTVTAAKAGVDRAKVLNQTVETLVNNQLRPGADASRTRAELALAQTQLIQAQEAVDVGLAALAQLLGVSPQSILIEAGSFLKPPQSATAPAAPLRTHPLAVTQDEAVNEVKAREKVLSRSYFPKFDLQAAAFARGTGINSDGTADGTLSGFAPNTQNWSVGISVTFSAFDLASIHARQQIEAHNERSETSRYQQILQDLTGQLDKAKATLIGSKRIAQNTPIELDAARMSERQAAARYKAGLGDVVEVAEAERILTQAEIDDSLAKLGIWRALLAVAAASGDLQPFLQETHK